MRNVILITINSDVMQICDFLPAEAQNDLKVISEHFTEYHK